MKNEITKIIWREEISKKEFRQLKQQPNFKPENFLRIPNHIFSKN